MKRMLALLLALVLVFALTACGAKEESPVVNAVSFKVVVTDLEGNETAKANASVKVKVSIIR